MGHTDPGRTLNQLTVALPSSHAREEMMLHAGLEHNSTLPGGQWLELCTWQRTDCKIQLMVSFGQNNNNKKRDWIFFYSLLMEPEHNTNKGEIERGNEITEKINKPFTFCLLLPTFIRPKSLCISSESNMLSLLLKRKHFMC